MSYLNADQEASLRQGHHPPRQGGGGCADSAQGWVLPEGWTPEYQREIEEVAASYYQPRRQAVEALCLLYRCQIGTDAVTNYMLVEQAGKDGTVRWWLQRKDREIQAPTLGKDGR